MPANESNVAGTTHDVTIDGEGLLIVPNTLRRWDTVPFAPAVRATNPKANDFSVSQFWTLDSWHHGRGALDWEDPFAFYDSANVLTHIKNQVLLAPLQLLTTKAASASLAGNPVVFRLVAAAANLFVATGGASRDVFQWDNTNGIWAAETSGITADPTDMIDYRGAIWVAQGDGTVMRRKASGTWGNAPGSAEADFLAVFGSSTMYRSDNVNEVYWTVDGGTTWNGPIYVGDTNTQIRSMVVGDGKLFVGKDDGLYYIQDQRAFQLLDFSWARDSNNFRHMKWWNGALYFPILHGLYRLIGSTLQAIGPEVGVMGAADVGTIGNINQGSFKSLASTKRGRIVDLATSGNFLYAVIDGADTGDISQILVYNGSGWHQIVQGAATSTRIRAAFLTGRLATSGQFNNPRLWFGYGNDAYNVIIPFGTDDPFEYTAQTYFTGTATLDSPWFDAGLSESFKEFISVHIYSEGLTANETVQVGYEMDDLGAFTNLTDANGNAYAFTVSPFQEILFPANTVCKKMRLRFTLARGGTNTLTPKLKKCWVEYVPRPNTKYAWQITARNGKQMRNPYTGRIEPRDPDEWSQLFYRWRDSRSRLQLDDGETEPGITNLVLNPEFRQSAAGLATNWNAVGTPTTTMSVIRKNIGLQSQQVVTAATGTHGVETDTITTVVGTRYTASAYVYLVSGDRVTIEFRDQTGSTVIASSQLLAVTTRFVRIEATGAATSTSSRVRIVRNTGDATAATTYNVCAAQLEITPDTRLHYREKATSFCSGNMTRCRWTGRADLSTSTRDAFYTVFLSSISRSEIYKPGIMERVRGLGTEHRHALSFLEVD